MTAAGDAADGRGGRLAGADLRYRDLRPWDLSGADLRGANLAGATLAGMVLRQTDLSGADLSAADFTGARLLGGSLRGATLAGSRWDRAAIAGTDGLDELAGQRELSFAGIAGRDPVEVMRAPAGPLHCVRFSPDGSLLAVGAGAAVWLVDTGSWTSLRVLSGHMRNVRSVRFSPDGSRIVSGAEDGAVRTWDARTGAAISAVEQDRQDRQSRSAAPVRDALFSPDGALQILACSYARAYVVSGAPVQYRHQSEPEVRAISPGGREHVWVRRDREPDPRNPHDGDWARDREILLINGTEADRHVQDDRGSMASFGAAVYSPDGTLVAVETKGGIVSVWDCGTRRWLSCAAVPVRGDALAISPDNARVAALAEDKVVVWESRTGRPVITLADGQEPVRGARPGASAIDFAPDGALVAAVTGHALRCWDAATGELRARLAAGQAEALNVACAPDAETVALTAADGTVRLWDTGTWAQRAVLRGHQRFARAIAFSADGAILAATSGDGEVRLWDPATGEPRKAPAPGHFTTSAAVSADGTTVLTGGSDGIARLWRLPRTRLQALRRPRRRPAALLGGQDGYGGAGGPMTAVALSPGGALAAAGSAADCAVRVWDAVTGELRAMLPGHHETVTGLAFVPGGATLVSASLDGTARAWDLAAEVLLATLVALPDGGYATLFPDGGYRTEHPGDRIWWAVGLGRFAPGELDPHLPAVRALRDAPPRCHPCHVPEGGGAG